MDQFLDFRNSALIHYEKEMFMKQEHAQNPMQSQPPKRNPLQIYIAAAMTQKGKLSLTMLLASISALLELVPYVFIWIIAKEAMAGCSTYVWWLTWGIFASVILRFACQAGVTMLGHLAGFQAEYVLRKKLLSHMRQVKPVLLEGKSAQLSRAVMDEVGKLNGIVAHTIPDLVASLLLCLFSMCLLFFTDWRLALAGLAMFLIGIKAQSLITKVSPELFGQWMAAETRAGRALLSYVRGVATLKAFNRQADSLGEVKDSIFAIGSLGSTLTKFCSMPFSLFDLAMVSPLFLILPLGLWFCSTGSLPLEDLLFFTAVGGVFLLPVRKIMHNLASLRTLQAAAGQLQQIMDMPVMDIPLTEAETAGAGHGARQGGQKAQSAAFRQTGSDTDCRADSALPAGYDIVFDQVSYAVGSPDKPTMVLHEVSFVLEEGSITTVTGPSGSGKTTLARLLARLDDVTSGSIRLGGMDIRSIPAETLHDMISVVFQDPALFHGTIRDNILLARPDATETELMQAFTAAGCARMLNAFPKGLDTIIGDRGLGLSGGERQRIAIARAFLKNAPILILDEATAHLDPVTARDISQSLASLMEGRTVLAISHRLCETARATSTLVLVNGSLEARGSHEELLDSSPAYKRLWQLQEQSMRWRLGQPQSRVSGAGTMAGNGEVQA